MSKKIDVEKNGGPESSVSKIKGRGWGEVDFSFFHKLDPYSPSRL